MSQQRFSSSGIKNKVNVIIITAAGAAGASTYNEIKCVTSQCWGFYLLNTEYSFNAQCPMCWFLTAAEHGATDWQLDWAPHLHYANKQLNFLPLLTPLQALPTLTLTQHSSFTHLQLLFSSCMKPQIVAEPVVLRSSISKRLPKLAFVGKGCGINKTCVNQISQKQWAEGACFSTPPPPPLSSLCTPLIFFGLWEEKHSAPIQVCTPVSHSHNSHNKTTPGRHYRGVVFTGLSKLVHWIFLSFCNSHHCVCWVVSTKRSSG